MFLCFNFNGTSLICITYYTVYRYVSLQLKYNFLCPSQFIVTLFTFIRLVVMAEQEYTFAHKRVYVFYNRMKRFI